MRILRVLSILAIIGLLIALGYSLVLTGVGLISATPGAGGSSGPTLSARFVGSSLELSLSVLLNNRGFFGIDGLTVEVLFSNATIGPGSLGIGHAGPQSVPGHGSLNLTVSPTFDLSDPAGAFLLTHLARLDADFWVNATYGQLLPLGLNFTSAGFPWAAPFLNLSYLAGTVGNVSATNETVPITTNFTNALLPLTEQGSLQEVFTASNGTRCGTVAVPLNAAAGPTVVTVPVTFTRGCQTTGDAVTAVFQGSGFSFPLPSEVLG